MAEPARKPIISGASPTPARTGPVVAPTPPGPRKLKKGDLLFNEGDSSRAMYLIKNGIIRIFKKKGDSLIEISTVHSGEIVGELAFLDGNPRSASGEALTDCDIVEISGPTFTAVLQTIPEWLKILLKTVVGRLRTASTRIRQLETASQSVDYSEVDGKRTSSYIYLSTPDVLKLSAALLLVGSRKSTQGAKGAEFKLHHLIQYANQIFQVPMAKLTSFLDILTQLSILKTEDQGTETHYYLADPDFLDQWMTYMNEENLLDPEKRHNLSIRGFLIMGLISKNIPTLKPEEKTGLTTVNLAEIKKNETQDGKEPFRFDDFNELMRLGYGTPLKITSPDDATTQVTAGAFLKTFRLQRAVMTLNALNEQKRKGSTR